MSIGEIELEKISCVGAYDVVCPICQKAFCGDCVFEIDDYSPFGYTALNVFEEGQEGNMRNKSSPTETLGGNSSNELDVRIGAGIRRIRELRKKSQGDFANDMGTTQGRISDIELGKRRVSISFLEAAAKRLQCDPVEFLLKL